LRNYRIPFGKSVRVTSQLGPETPASPLFWWIIRGTENLPLFSKFNCLKSDLVSDP
jgi:hypothetical protein